MESHFPRGPADINDNKFANTLDLLVYLTALNKPMGEGDPVYVQGADLNGNGTRWTWCRT